jgi:hypothetical protein
MKNSTLSIINKKLFIFCLMLLFGNIVFGQKPAEKKPEVKKPIEKKLVERKPIEKNNILSNKWSIDFNGGSTQYWGNLMSRNFGTTLKHSATFGYGIILTRQISPVFSIRGQFLMGNLKGRKELFSNDSSANLNYHSNFLEGNISVKMSFTDLIMGYKPNRSFALYGIAGIGLSNFQGETVNYNTGIPVNRFGYGSGKGIKGYELDGIATLGIGMTFRLSKAWNITFENSIKSINENKLNEINSKIPFDFYGYSSLGLSYKIGLKKTTKIQPVKISDQAKPKPIEEKKEVIPAPKVEPKPEVKKEVAAPVKTEPKITPPEPVKQAAKPDGKNSLFTGYKVQIIATQRADSFDNIMLQYHLKEQIREDHTDKWYRYSVGEFKSYLAASKYRRILNTRNKIKGGFVVKFKDGKRIGPVWK